ncbi:hypothetical protein [Paenibacillus periandrae]|uniref:hypothetical protein n=1 Tax=Paenibacillus periandrae TaxID=1761741 RepID=UPI001F089033|nr:hypothetical protein [Paenibacillus periandrae]
MATTVTFRIYTGVGNSWKINLTELDITGKAPSTTFANLQSIAVEPGIEPYNKYNIDQAQTLLTDGLTSYGSNYGVYYDFFGKPLEDRYAKITVELDHETYIDTLDLSAFSLNSYFSLNYADISFIDAAGTGVINTVYGTGNTNRSGLATVNFKAAYASLSYLLAEKGDTVSAKELLEYVQSRIGPDEHGVNFEEDLKSYNKNPKSTRCGCANETHIAIQTKLPHHHYQKYQAGSSPTRKRKRKC